MTKTKEQWQEELREQQRKMHEFHEALLRRLKDHLPKLKDEQRNADREFGAPDLFYRFYHQSFKFYRIQGFTVDWTEMFRELGGCPLNKWYEQIVSEGTHKVFDLSHNENWLMHTRPILEAYFHARMFLDQMVWCAENMEEAAHVLPSPWAAVLYLYEKR